MNTKVSRYNSAEEVIRAKLMIADTFLYIHDRLLPEDARKVSEAAMALGREHGENELQALSEFEMSVAELSLAGKAEAARKEAYERGLAERRQRQEVDDKHRCRLRSG